MRRRNDVLTQMARSSALWWLGLQTVAQRRVVMPLAEMPIRSRQSRVWCVCVQPSPIYRLANLELHGIPFLVVLKHYETNILSNFLNHLINLLSY